MLKNIELLIPDSRWFQAPLERTPQFFLTYAKVSVALQQALRQLAPRAYFADLGHYESGAAVAMLAYAASRPFRPKSRTDFTYDITNPAMMRTFFRISRRKMIAGLAEAQARLTEAGHSDVAKMFDPREVRHILASVKKHRRFRKPIHRLLLAEGKLLNELTGFSGLEDASPKERAKKNALILKKWRSTLAHLCLGSDLSGLAPELFRAVTKAYLAVNEPDAVEELEPLDDDDTIADLETSDDLLDWAA